MNEETLQNDIRYSISIPNSIVSHSVLPCVLVPNSHLIQSADLASISQRSGIVLSQSTASSDDDGLISSLFTVLKRLEDRYGIDLALFKAFIYQVWSFTFFPNLFNSLNTTAAKSEGRRGGEVCDSMHIPSVHNAIAILILCLLPLYLHRRVRIDNDPNLQQQQQQRSRSKFYREINGGQSDIPYNTIYTPSNVHQSQAQPLALPLPLPKFGPPVNYSEVKAHYLNINSSSDSRKRKRETPSDGTDGEESGSSNDDNSSDGPKSKKRRLSSQSTRESDKDTVYPLSPRFQEMMGRQEGSWRLCWDWIMDHAKANQLRVGNRKIRCDEVLQKVFERQETSVSGVSRLIWKELVGAIDVDAKTGKFKKLVYRKRQKKARQSEESGGSSSSYGTEEEKEVNEKNGQSQGEIDKQFGYLSDHLARYKKHFGYQYKGSGEGTAAEKASRPKRRYRRKERDAEGNVIKKKRNSGLTRMCFMSQELKSIVGEEGPLPRYCAVYSPLLNHCCDWLIGCWSGTSLQRDFGNTLRYLVV